MAETAAEETPTTRPVFLHLKHGEFDWMPSKEQTKEMRDRMKSYEGWVHVTGEKKRGGTLPIWKKIQICTAMSPTLCIT